MLAALAALLGLAACGSGQAGPASATRGVQGGGSCAATVVETLRHVVEHVYKEGVASERTILAHRAIAGSAALRAAVEADDPTAAAAATSKLLAGGRLTNLIVTRGGQTLVSTGPPALTPLGGAITGAGGATIASYITSVWSDGGFLAESEGISEGRVALLQNGASVGGSETLPGELGSAGTLTLHGRQYAYSSFAGEAFPTGGVRVYLLRSIASTRHLCGASSEDTTVRTIARVAHLIYDGEKGARTIPQIRRVQHSQSLLAAVAAQDPVATRAAIASLLNQHIVRLRVMSASGQLLADVGGPYVLAPVTAPLRLGGKRIGSFVLSLQDDEGYLRLARRLAGLRVLMYMNVGGTPTLVKNSLGPVGPGIHAVPSNGAYTYRGHEYRVFTLHARAFPSGPLTVRVLIPMPYS